MINCIIILLILIFLYLLSIRCRRGHSDWGKLQGWLYAHRGLHGNGIPENSMRAFRKAKDAGFGIELDLHLMADGNLAVIHDASLKRTANADVFVEDLCSDQLNDYYLENTLETIPDFRDVLNLINGEIPLIVELKCERNNYAELCETACKLLDSYSGDYCLESFDPRCIRWLKVNRPELIRGQLSENYFRTSGSTLPWYLKFTLVNQLLSFLTVPDFIAYRFSDRKTLSNYLCRKLWGAHGVTWTIRSKEDLAIAVKEKWIPIFEGFTP